MKEILVIEEKATGERLFTHIAMPDAVAAQQVTRLALDGDEYVRHGVLRNYTIELFDFPIEHLGGYRAQAHVVE